MTAETIIQSLRRIVIASEAKQSMPRKERMDCFVAALPAMTNDNASDLEQHL
jgi:hypothetical protein